MINDTNTTAKVVAITTAKYISAIIKKKRCYETLKRENSRENLLRKVEDYNVTISGSSPEETLRYLTKQNKDKIANEIATHLYYHEITQCIEILTQHGIHTMEVLKAFEITHEFTT